VTYQGNQVTIDLGRAEPVLRRIEQGPPRI
jgi:hypothetical protein